MRIRKQQRDRCMTDFNCAGALHLLAAASVSNNVVHAAHEAAAVLQLQTSVSDVDAVEAMIIQDEKKICSFGDSQVVKVEGEASSSVSDYGGSTKRIREEQAGIKWIGVGLDSKKLQQKAGKMETSSNKLSPLTLLSSKITSDSSYLDIRSSCSVQQQQTLQISSCRSRSFPQTEPRNGGGNSSSEEKAYTGRRSLKQKKGLNTNIQSTGRHIMDGEQEKIHVATHVLDTYTYSPDPFAMDAEPDSKKLKVLKQAKIGHFFPQSSHHRFSRKPRASPKTYGDKIFGVIPEQSSMLSPLGAAVQLPVPLSPDHPLNHSKESLLHAVYKVFLQAGKAGLTAREAASRVVEQGFPGHHQGGVMGRVEVGKLLRSSPFFMELEEGRFALFSAIIGGNEESLAKTGVEAEAQAQKTEVEMAARAQKTEVSAETQAQKTGLEAEAQAPKKARQKGRWTGIPPLFKVEVEDIPMDIKVESEESCLETRLLQQSKSRRRLIQLTQEGDIELGDQCNRTDGKSWHCPLRARMGYQLCDYHLNKLRIKTTSNLPRKPNPAVVVEQQVSSGSTPDDSWLQVPKTSVWWDFINYYSCWSPCSFTSVLIGILGNVT
ncbi:unnamed protein product [Sphagnum troendelagicum]|uniref:WRC domain-containing protein n=1 Tax=Sphagnum troendelagicum TaxID=128251 RepID=A0ABP0TY35_9BRYO